MHSSEFLMELVADSYYRKFLAYGIGGESVHDYLQILFYRADAVRQDKVEGGPVRGYDESGVTTHALVNSAVDISGTVDILSVVLSESTVLSPVFRVEYMA